MISKNDKALNNWCLWGLKLKCFKFKVYSKVKMNIKKTNFATLIAIAVSTDNTLHFTHWSTEAH